MHEQLIPISSIWFFRFQLNSNIGPFGCTHSSLLINALTHPMDNQLTVAVEITNCKACEDFYIRQDLSPELTHSAIQFFKFHPNFKHVSTTCLNCGALCDVEIVFETQSSLTPSPTPPPSSPHPQ